MKQQEYLFFQKLHIMGEPPNYLTSNSIFQNPPSCYWIRIGNFLSKYFPKQKKLGIKSNNAHLSKFRDLLALFKLSPWNFLQNSTHSFLISIETFDSFQTELYDWFSFSISIFIWKNIFYYENPGAKTKSQCSKHRFLVQFIKNIFQKNLLYVQIKYEFVSENIFIHILWILISYKSQMVFPSQNSCTKRTFWKNFENFKISLMLVLSKRQT